MRVFLFSFFLILFTSQAVAGETYFIRSLQGKLLSAPNFKSESVAVLKQGEAVELLTTKGSWVKVKSQSDKEGWLSKFLLSKTKPKQKRPQVLEFDEEQTSNVRKRVSVITTAAAARGLTTKEAEENLNKPVLQGQNFDALKLMESYRPTAEEVDAFIRSIPLAE